MACSMLAHPRSTIETVSALVRNQPVVLIVGLVTLAAGLALVLLHNVWTGGAATILITAISWLTLFKGMVFLFVSPEDLERFYLGTLQFEKLFYLYTGLSLVLGIILIYLGFRRPTRV